MCQIGFPVNSATVELLFPISIIEEYDAARLEPFPDRSGQGHICLPSCDQAAHT